MLNDGIPCSKNDRIPIGDIYLNFVNVSMIPNNVITPIDAPIITFGDSFVREIKLIINENATAGMTDIKYNTKTSSNSATGIDPPNAICPTISDNKKFILTINVETNIINSTFPKYNCVTVVFVNNVNFRFPLL